MTPRTAAAAPFAVLGLGCAIAGGLASAVIAPHPTPHGAWAVAYLVLVGGIAQLGLGIGQALLAPEPPASRLVFAQIAAWNLGNAAVLGGTLSDTTPLADIGGALLAVGLARLVLGVRGGSPDGRRRWVRHGFQALVVLLLVSIPAGLVLARIGPA
ncbi:hypothetical protein L3Q65_15775 [Amycolatopsis sp. FU40]|uniref:hypothetical protein n=1 Tax=Amycolatopsis sp. FU40 TaxID=2914159 RepID=UPI001F459465|nr:hypothetical protein [Amycolatopsis sp. FU40]UKD58125.1 hypothetical protein L3Q65_15775 [Amycolatopsis sp. FU40]